MQALLTASHELQYSLLRARHFCVKLLLLRSHPLPPSSSLLCQLLALFLSTCLCTGEAPTDSRFLVQVPLAAGHEFRHPLLSTCHLSCNLLLLQAFLLSASCKLLLQLPAVGPGAGPCERAMLWISGLRLFGGTLLTAGHKIQRFPTCARHFCCELLLLKLQPVPAAGHVLLAAGHETQHTLTRGCNFGCKLLLLKLRPIPPVGHILLAASHDTKHLLTCACHFRCELVRLKLHPFPPPRYVLLAAGQKVQHSLTSARHLR
mmetsp:Transcript_92727/g.262215  ORF Transcript_92727/g.262215 Transcript_92727/m.262215 type:complete len:261 (-) Transcript_92727:582-1364(-)